MTVGYASREDAKPQRIHAKKWRRVGLHNGTMAWSRVEESFARGDAATQRRTGEAVGKRAELRRLGPPGTSVSTHRVARERPKQGLVNGLKRSSCAGTGVIGRELEDIHPVEFGRLEV